MEQGMYFSQSLSLVNEQTAVIPLSLLALGFSTILNTVKAEELGRTFTGLFPAGE